VDLLHILLRLVHVGSGILWVGGSVVFFLFVEPTASELGPDAEKFMQRMIVKRRLPIYFLVLSSLTVIAGLVLYWMDSDGLRAVWIGTSLGLALTVGGIAALIAFVGGNALIKPNIDRIAAIAASIKAGGGPPSQAQLGELQAVQRRLRTIGLVDTVLLAVAVVAMVSARYL
jgi:uncharacterized membrane protein